MNIMKISFEASGKTTLKTRKQASPSRSTASIYASIENQCRKANSPLFTKKTPKYPPNNAKNPHHGRPKWHGKETWEKERQLDLKYDIGQGLWVKPQSLGLGYQPNIEALRKDRYQCIQKMSNLPK